MILSKKEIQFFKLPEHFSIQDVNNINLLELAYSYGYNEPSKNSANNVVLKNKVTGDKLVVYKNTNNQYFFNPDNDSDKGKAYHFILNRLNGTIQPLQNPTSFEKRSVFVVAAQFLNTPQAVINLDTENTKTKPVNNLKENINIQPLLKKEFLKARDISNNTLVNPKFKNHIFNAYAPGKNEGTFIPNIAFPLYHPTEENKVTGYEIRNNKFKSILGNHSHLWHSEIPNKATDIAKIIYGESAIDAISHFELNKTENKDSVYYSFSGNIYDTKINTFLESIEPLLKDNPNITFESITDNDNNGAKYDFRILTSFINKFTDGIHIEFNPTKEDFKFHIHNTKDNLDTIHDIDLTQIRNDLKLFNTQLNPLLTKGAVYGRKNIIDLELPNANLSYKVIFDYMAKRYLPNIKMELAKPLKEFKDWNEQLQRHARENKKKTKGFKI